MADHMVHVWPCGTEADGPSGWKPVCICGWTGSEHLTRLFAAKEALAHEAAASVTEARRG